MRNLFTRLIGIGLVAIASLAWVVDAEARRLGGGGSFGRQSNITQRQATPPAAAPAPTQVAQAGAARTGSRWMAPMAGLAAGLGLAALASWMGFGEELASFMLIALLVIAGVVVFRMLAARRQGQAGPRPAFQGGYANAGAGQDSTVRYSPAPQERAGGGMSGPAAGAMAGAGASVDSGIPADFDVNGFLRAAKVQFIRLQAVNDAGDLNDLREFTSPEAYAELSLAIAERGATANRTDVVTLVADLLGIETTPVDYLASVRFTGMIREDDGGEAKPFDELWVLSRPVSGAGGWVLAGIQQLG